MASPEAQEKVEKILEEAFGKDDKGNQLMDANDNLLFVEDHFRIDAKSEENIYWSAIRCGKNRFITQNIDTIQKHYERCKSIDKSFVFFCIPGKDYEDYIFSLEIIELRKGTQDKNITTITLCNEETLKTALKSKKDIIRIFNLLSVSKEKEKNQSKCYTVNANIYLIHFC